MDSPPHLYLCLPSQIDYWLSTFVLEIRQKDGKPYTPGSLYQICCGLMHYIRELKPSVNFFTDKDYSNFQRTLDAEMKRLRRDGIGAKVKRVEPISIDEEERLWSMGLLGDGSPQS